MGHEEAPKKFAFLRKLKKKLVISDKEG